MARPLLPAVNQAPNWAQTLIDGIYAVSDAADAAKASADGKLASNTYLNARAGQRFDIWYEDGPNAWPAARPSAAAGVYFNLCGGLTTDDGPTWMINRDARDYVGTT